MINLVGLIKSISVKKGSLNTIGNEEKKSYSIMKMSNFYLSWEKLIAF